VVGIIKFAFLFIFNFFFFSWEIVYVLSRYSHCIPRFLFYTALHLKEQEYILDLGGIDELEVFGCHGIVGIVGAVYDSMRLL
jgi:hypothetical protein